MTSRPAKSRRSAALRRIRLRLARAAIKAKMREFRDLAFVPHEIGDRAQALLRRLDRRERAIDRMIARLSADFAPG